MTLGGRPLRELPHHLWKAVAGPTCVEAHLRRLDALRMCRTVCPRECRQQELPEARWASGVAIIKGSRVRYQRATDGGPWIGRKHAPSARGSVVNLPPPGGVVQARALRQVYYASARCLYTGPRYSSNSLMVATTCSRNQRCAGAASCRVCQNILISGTRTSMGRR